MSNYQFAPFDDRSSKDSDFMHAQAAPLSERLQIQDLPLDTAGLVEIHQKLVDEEATSAGLKLPKITQDDYLNMRLSRSDNVLILDQDAILLGVKELEVEHHSAVVIKGKERGDDSADPELIPPKSTHWRDADDDEVTLVIDATPTDEEDSEHLANIGFWSAVLTSEIIGDDKMKHEKITEILEDLDDVTSKSLIGTIGTIAAVNGAKLTLYVAGHGLPLIPSAIATAGQVVGQSAFSIRGKNARKKKQAIKHGDQDMIFDAIRQDILKVAIQLARKYKPLRYVPVDQAEDLKKDMATEAIIRTISKREMGL